MNKMQLEIVKDLILYGNNKISIILTKNIESMYYTKYIEV